ncbi:hypothetical protein J2W48_001947 [Flavobacterium piscis]|uniref:Uncharacterized protein n=1 Tax=Flavobacterium piscis TaxID=1114874 RepID=A0ABU1Y6Z6_9FLAO|nr:hypothetical protein [Flavobacterium piscis]
MLTEKFQQVTQIAKLIAVDSQNWKSNLPIEIDDIFAR